MGYIQNVTITSTNYEQKFVIDYNYNCFCNAVNINDILVITLVLVISSQGRNWKASIYFTASGQTKIMHYG